MPLKSPIRAQIRRAKKGTCLKYSFVIQKKKRKRNKRYQNICIFIVPYIVAGSDN